MWRAVRKRFEAAALERQKRWKDIEAKIESKGEELLTAFKEHEALDLRREEKRDREHEANLLQLGRLKVAVARLGSKDDLNGH